MRERTQGILAFDEMRGTLSPVLSSAIRGCYPQIPPSAGGQGRGITECSPYGNVRIEPLILVVCPPAKERSVDCDKSTRKAKKPSILFARMKKDSYRTASYLSSRGTRDLWIES